MHELVACLREADVTHYLAHPLFDMSGKLTPESVERMLLLFNVLEGRNGARTSRCNGLLRAIAESLTREQIEAMAERQGIEPYGETPWRKALTGGSDDHSGLFSASACTVAGGDGTAEGFLRAVAAGHCAHAGADGDARLLAPASTPPPSGRSGRSCAWTTGDEAALGLLRKGFGRIGREVPVLEKTLRGVRSIAPGLYRDGDPRGPAWEALLEEEIGSLVAHPDGINAVDAKELNRRLFVVAQRLADEVMGMHLRALLDRDVRMGLKQRLQSIYAVGMVAFLEIPTTSPGASRAATANCRSSCAPTSWVSAGTRAGRRSRYCARHRRERRGPAATAARRRDRARERPAPRRDTTWTSRCSPVRWPPRSPGRRRRLPRARLKAVATARRRAGSCHR